MKYTKEIEVLKKIYNCEIDIDDISYEEVSKELCFNAGNDAVKYLYELFDDKCYEISLMDDLTETIFYIVNRNKIEGLLEVARCIKNVPDGGKYFGVDHMIKKIMNTDDLYTLWVNIVNELDEKDKTVILDELLRMDFESEGILKKRIETTIDKIEM